MWFEDKEGTAFSGPKEAFESLRDRARNTIAAADHNGFDVRHVVVRLRDETGTVLFEGTMEDAARLQIDGQVFLPAKLDPKA